MFHPQIGPTARTAIALAVFVPSLAAAGGAYLGLDSVDAPELVASFVAALIAVTGIITITHRIETIISQQAG